VESFGVAALFISLRDYEHAGWKSIIRRYPNPIPWYKVGPQKGTKAQNAERVLLHASKAFYGDASQAFYGHAFY
jgi:hypothetical protein